MEHEDTYYSQQYRPVFMSILCGFLVFFALLYAVPLFLYAFNYTGNPDLMMTYSEKYFSGTNMDSILSNDLILVSYNYNARKPHIFTKNKALANQEGFDVSLSTAVAAATA